MWVGFVTRQGFPVVPLVISLINVRTQEPCWSHIEPCSTSRMRVVEHISWLIYARRRELNSRWRRLGCFKQALLVLVYLRKNKTLAQAGAGFEVSTATAGRYVTETVDVLAQRAPSLLDALQDHDPHEFLVLDGTLIRPDRVAADEPYYSMKHRHHGMNVQVLARPDGTPVWFSRALPSRTHDLNSARAHGVIQAYLPADPHPGRPCLPRRRSHRPDPVLRSGPAGEIRTVRQAPRPAHRPRQAPQTPNPGPAPGRPHPPLATPRHRGSLRRRHPGNRV